MSHDEEREALLPCPFCGHRAMWPSKPNNDLYWISCTHCEAEMSFGTREGCVAMWQARAALAHPADAMDAEEWRELYRLREAVKGPDGYATWQDAATAERVRRVKAERALGHPVGDGDALSALEELVACRSLKDRFTHPSIPDLDSGRLPDIRREYERRKPLAWERARAVIAASLRASVDF